MRIPPCERAATAWRSIAMILSMSIVTALSAGAFAQTKPTRSEAGSEPVKSIPWVGNSFFYYNNSMHGHYGELARADDPAGQHRGVSVTISGSGLDWHDLASHLRPYGIGKYSRLPGNTIAYKDKPEMTAQLAEQYTLAGNANDALVIPAGLAFAKAIARRPELELHQPDKRHPTLAGTYHAAWTTYAAIQKRSPIGNKYSAGLDPELATFLQTAAAYTARDYCGRRL